MVGLALALAVLAAWGQQAAREPYAGYVYPPGGQQGALLQVTVGGQNLRGVSGAHITGEGVEVSVIEYARALTPNLLRDAARNIRAIIRERLGRAPANRPGDDQEELPPIPDHPWFRDLESRSTAELRELAARLFDPRKQANAQIAELVLLSVMIAPDAPPGERELRLITPIGVTPPLRFQVGRLPEVSEPDPMAPTPPPMEPLTPPVVINGQILPGEVDRFPLQARAGQRLVMAAQARHLIPYLADAVPGWFQAVLTLRDAEGRELACVDDYRFDPDPVLFYEVPADGVYTLEIRDSIYRGREDFVYRITVGELPFVTQLFPLGGREGTPTTVSLAGWNLPRSEVALDTAPGGRTIRQTTWDDMVINPVSYAVDTLPESVESEPNDAPGQGERLDVPQIVNGRIARAGDVDCFRFEGHAGEEIVAEVLARRLGSPLDALLALTDADGTVLASNDDHEDPGAGLVTHHADSYLAATLPATGMYILRLSDIQRHGGDEYAYRLRVSPPRPDFELRVTPASIGVIAGRSAPITVHVLRRDGFTGEVEVTLADAPPGLKLSGGHIPAGRDRVRMTLTAPPRPYDGPVEIGLEGRAHIAGETVVRPVTPAVDMMQAFIYRHLVPAQSLVLAVGRGRPVAPTARCTDSGPLRIPAGGSARIPIEVTMRPNAELPIFFALSEPPEGLVLESVAKEPGGAVLVIKADKALAGHADNLIIETSTEIEFRRRQGEPVKQRVSLGTLPAIAYEVVQP